MDSSSYKGPVFNIYVLHSAVTCSCQIILRVDGLSRISHKCKKVKLSIEGREKRERVTQPNT